VDDPQTTPEPADPLESLVEEFVRRLEEDGQVDLERFCASAPSGLQSALRERCADVLVLRRILPAPLAARAPHPPSTGQVLGEFRLLSEIGRGAMGVVYLARQQSLHRVVALKVLYPHLSGLERSVERFRREAKSAARLRHPAICPVYSVGEERGLYYFAMEYVDGRSLAGEIEALRRRRAERRAPAPDERVAIDPTRSYEAQVAELVANIAEALHYAHGEGVIHRDVKPHNILIGRDGRPFLVDFGLAKDRDDPSISRTGEVAGTPYYMSPEQAEGRRRELDARTDVFSLGVVLYELLTLRRPFSARSSQQLMLQIATVLPEPPRRLNPDVSRDLEVVCLHALEKSPQARYASAGEFAADLRRFLGHQSILARPPSTAEILRRRLRQHRTALLAAGAAVVVTLTASWVRSDLRARELARSLSRELSTMDLRRATAAGDVVALTASLELARTAQALGDELDPPARQRAIQLEREIVEHARAQVELALADLAQASAAQAKELEEGPWRLSAPAVAEDRNTVLLAFQRLSLAALAPGLEDEPRVREVRAAGIKPRLTIRTAQPGAKVWLRRMSIDGLAPAVLVGETPLDRAPLDPGAYRVVVASDDGAFAEVTRVFERLHFDYELEPNLRAPAEVSNDMVLVPAGEVRHRSIHDPELVLREGRVEQAFWIDKFEVTNAEYRRYTEATGRPGPVHWADFEFAAIADKPVVAIRWFEASQYAEWAGKRLPTMLEWQVAARGAQGWMYPWGDDVGELQSRAALPHASSKAPQDYLAWAEPAISRADGASPWGLLHTLDNVSEWCEDLAPTRAPRPTLRYDTALFLGGSFASDPQFVRLPMASSTATDNIWMTVGFRCAKSDAP
jgi:serine/threonine protein kinase/formylglycine-generating enzyme required for sulfatase activity